MFGLRVSAILGFGVSDRVHPRREFRIYVYRAYRVYGFEIGFKGVAGLFKLRTYGVLSRVKGLGCRVYLVRA